MLYSMLSFCYHITPYSNLFGLLSQSGFQGAKIQYRCTLAPCKDKLFNIVNSAQFTVVKVVLLVVPPAPAPAPYPGPPVVGLALAAVPAMC